MFQRDLFSEPPAEPRILSVWELTSQLKTLVEDCFPAVCVVGEISDYTRPRSGHCYFTLKDDQAQLRGVIWRSTAGRLRFDLHDGLEVICRGHLEVYAPRGTYQLIVEQIEPKWVGALELAFRQLRDRLTREGLFAPERKRPLPRFAQRIGLVTSPSGAAIRDFLQVLGRRWRGGDVLVAPVAVQGEGAAEQVAEAIATLNRMPRPVDCIVVVRGGGSLEDLWAFNEEVVVRAIRASQIPVLTGIGHEVDVTLADLAADVRALTPSEAAELIAPAAEEIAAGLQQYQKRMNSSLRARLDAARARLEALTRHRALRRPYAQVQDLARRLDELELRMGRSMQQQVRRAREGLGAQAARLESLSPLAVLARGYSLTQRATDGQVIRSAEELSVGERMVTRFAQGQAVSRVEEVTPER